jgi:hypothetical protein
MKYCILFVFVAFTCLALGADFSIRPEGDAVTIHGTNGTTVMYLPVSSNCGLSASQVMR